MCVWRGSRRIRRSAAVRRCLRFEFRKKAAIFALLREPSDGEAKDGEFRGKNEKGPRRVAEAFIVVGLGVASRRMSAAVKRCLGFEFRKKTAVFAPVREPSDGEAKDGEFRGKNEKGPRLAARALVVVGRGERI